MKRSELIDFLVCFKKQENVSILPEFGRLDDKYLYSRDKGNISKCNLNRDYECCRIWQQNNCECLGCEYVF